MNSFEASNRFVPFITTLFHKESKTMLEPDDISNAPSIPSTLKIHKLVRRVKESNAEIEFPFLSNSDEPCFVQRYSEYNMKCGHEEISNP